MGEVRPARRPTVAAELEKRAGLLASEGLTRVRSDEARWRLALENAVELLAGLCVPFAEVNERVGDVAFAFAIELRRRRVAFASAPRPPLTLDVGECWSIGAGSGVPPDLRFERLAVKLLNGLGVVGEVEGEDAETSDRLRESSRVGECDWSFRVGFSGIEGHEARLWGETDTLRSVLVGLQLDRLYGCSGVCRFFILPCRCVGEARRPPYGQDPAHLLALGPVRYATTRGGMQDATRLLDSDSPARCYSHCCGVGCLSLAGVRDFCSCARACDVRVVWVVKSRERSGRRSTRLGRRAWLVGLG